jgi:hypothetical protein
MKHTYNEEEKDRIAQIVYDWLIDHKCCDADLLCQDDECVIDSVDLACDLADVKQVYFYED